MPNVIQLQQKFFPTGANSAPIHSANSDFIPLFDGEEYFRAIYTAISSCEGFGDFIYIVGWWFQPTMRLVDPDNPNTPSLSSLLLQKARAGVDVRIILSSNLHLIEDGDAIEFSRWLAGLRWAPDWLDRNLPDVRGYREITSQNLFAAMELRYRGVQPSPLLGRVLLDWSGELSGSHHQKATIVKAGYVVTAFVGGIDYHQTRWDRQQHPSTSRSGWHDAGVQVHGHAVLGVFENFKTRWTECMSLPPRTYNFSTSTTGIRHGEYNPLTEAIATPFPDLRNLIEHSPPGFPGLPTTQQSCQVLRSYGPAKTHRIDGSLDLTWATLPATGIQEVRDTVMWALQHAESFIYIEDQQFSAASLFSQIVDAANRGVLIIVLKPGAADPADRITGPINAVIPNDIQDLIINRIDPSKRTNFVLWRLDHCMVHSKLILIDDQFLSIGSANFIDRSMTGTDSELTVAMVDGGVGIRDARMNLWAEHFRVNLSDTVVREYLQDLNRCLTLWRSTWGWGGAIPFTYSSNLVQVGP